MKRYQWALPTLLGLAGAGVVYLAMTLLSPEPVTLENGLSSALFLPGLILLLLGVNRWMKPGGQGGYRSRPVRTQAGLRMMGDTTQPEAPDADSTTVSDRKFILARVIPGLVMLIAALLIVYTAVF